MYCESWRGHWPWIVFIQKYSTFSSIIVYHLMFSWSLLDDMCVFSQLDLSIVQAPFFAFLGTSTEACWYRRTDEAVGNKERTYYLVKLADFPLIIINVYEKIVYSDSHQFYQYQRKRTITSRHNWSHCTQWPRHICWKSKSLLGKGAKMWRD